MERAETLLAWRELAAAHDQLTGADLWKSDDDSPLYDTEQIRDRYRRLRSCCEANVSEEILFALNEGIHGNMGGMGNAALYEHAKLGTKTLIDEYVQTICLALQQVANSPDAQVPFDQKLDFFRRASHCFGRSALAMSGGSGLVYFHHGVVQELFEAGLLPRILSGASAGAWMCAQLGTRNDEELKGYFPRKRYSFDHGLSRGQMLGLLMGQNRDVMERERDDVIESFVGDMTFQEAYEHTGRYINISIAPSERHQTSRLMNAIASPNVTIRSAVRASSSLPGMVNPVALEAKDSRGRTRPYLRHRRWVDGSVSDDLPFKRISRLFGVNHYIVSLINPLVVPFIRRDPRVTPDSLSKSLASVYFHGLKETIKTARRWSSSGVLERADAILGNVYQVMNQKYSGNINIMLKPSQVRTRYMLFEYSGEDDIQALIQAGQRACWPKLEQIRISTKISSVVDELLEELEHDSFGGRHLTKKRHMTL